MSKYVNIIGHGPLAFPDTMSDEEIQVTLKTHFGTPEQAAKQFSALRTSDLSAPPAADTGQIPKAPAAEFQAPVTPKKSKDLFGGEFAKGVTRGWINIGTSHIGHGEIAADLLGADKVGSYLHEKESYLNELRKALPPKVPSVEAAFYGSLGDKFDYAMGKIGEAAPQMVAMLLPGVLIGRAVYGAKQIADPVLRAARLAGAKKVATAAVAGSTLMQESGGQYQELEERGVKAPITSLAVGAANAALEVSSLGPMGRLLEKLFKDAGPEAARFLWRKVVRDFFSETLKQAGSESMTEGKQEVVNIIGTVIGERSFDLVNTPEKVHKNAMRVLESVVSGGIAGGAMGAGMSPIHTGMQLYDQAKAENDPAKLAEARRLITVGVEAAVKEADRIAGEPFKEPEQPKSEDLQPKAAEVPAQPQVAPETPPIVQTPPSEADAIRAEIDRLTAENAAMLSGTTPAQVPPAPTPVQPAPAPVPQTPASVPQTTTSVQIAPAATFSGKIVSKSGGHIPGNYQSFLDAFLSDLKVEGEATPLMDFYVSYANSIRRKLREKYGNAPREKIEETIVDATTGKENNALQIEANAIAREIGNIVGNRVRSELKGIWESGKDRFVEAGITKEEVDKILAKIDQTAVNVSNLVSGSSPPLGSFAIEMFSNVTKTLWSSAHNQIAAAVSVLNPDVRGADIDRLVWKIMTGKSDGFIPKQKQASNSPTQAIAPPSIPTPVPSVPAPVPQTPASVPQFTKGSRIEFDRGPKDNVQTMSGTVVEVLKSGSIKVQVDGLKDSFTIVRKSNNPRMFAGAPPPVQPPAVQPAPTPIQEQPKPVEEEAQSDLSPEERLAKSRSIFDAMRQQEERSRVTAEKMASAIPEPRQSVKQKQAASMALMRVEQPAVVPAPSRKEAVQSKLTEAQKGKGPEGEPIIEPEKSIKVIVDQNIPDQDLKKLRSKQARWWVDVVNHIRLNIPQTLGIRPFNGVRFAKGVGESGMVYDHATDSIVIDLDAMENLEQTLGKRYKQGVMMAIAEEAIHGFHYHAVKAEYMVQNQTDAGFDEWFSDQMNQIWSGLSDDIKKSVIFTRTGNSNGTVNPVEGGWEYVRMLIQNAQGGILTETVTRGVTPWAGRLTLPQTRNILASILEPLKLDSIVKTDYASKHIKAINKLLITHQKALKKADKEAAKQKVETDLDKARQHEAWNKHEPKIREDLRKIIEKKLAARLGSEAPSVIVDEVTDHIYAKRLEGFARKYNKDKKLVVGNPIYLQTDINDWLKTAKGQAALNSYSIHKPIKEGDERSGTYESAIPDPSTLPASDAIAAGEEAKILADVMATINKPAEVAQHRQLFINVIMAASREERAEHVKILAKQLKVKTDRTNQLVDEFKHAIIGEAGKLINPHAAVPLNEKQYERAIRALPTVEMARVMGSTPEELQKTRMLVDDLTMLPNYHAIIPINQDLEDIQSQVQDPTSPVRRNKFLNGLYQRKQLAERLYGQSDRYAFLTSNRLEENAMNIPDSNPETREAVYQGFTEDVLNLRKERRRLDWVLFKTQNEIKKHTSDKNVIATDKARAKAIALKEKARELLSEFRRQLRLRSGSIGAYGVQLGIANMTQETINDIEAMMSKKAGVSSIGKYYESIANLFTEEELADPDLTSSEIIQIVKDNQENLPLIPKNVLALMADLMSLDANLKADLQDFLTVTNMPDAQYSSIMEQLIKEISTEFNSDDVRGFIDKYTRAKISENKALAAVARFNKRLDRLNQVMRQAEAARNLYDKLFRDPAFMENTKFVFELYNVESRFPRAVVTQGGPDVGEEVDVYTNPLNQKEQVSISHTFKPEEEIKNYNNIKKVIGWFLDFLNSDQAAVYPEKRLAIQRRLERILAIDANPAFHPALGKELRRDASVIDPSQWPIINRAGSYEHLGRYIPAVLGERLRQATFLYGEVQINAMSAINTYKYKSLRACARAAEAKGMELNTWRKEISDVIFHSYSWPGLVQIKTGHKIRNYVVTELDMEAVRAQKTFLDHMIDYSTPERIKSKFFDPVKVELEEYNVTRSLMSRTPLMVPRSFHTDYITWAAHWTEMDPNTQIEEMVEFLNGDEVFERVVWSHLESIQDPTYSVKPKYPSAYREVWLDVYSGESLMPTDIHDLVYRITEAQNELDPENPVNMNDVFTALFHEISAGFHNVINFHTKRSVESLSEVITDSRSKALYGNKPPPRVSYVSSNSFLTMPRDRIVAPIGAYKYGVPTDADVTQIYGDLKDFYAQRVVQVLSQVDRAIEKAINDLTERVKKTLPRSKREHNQAIQKGSVFLSQNWQAAKSWDRKAYLDLHDLKKLSVDIQRTLANTEAARNYNSIALHGQEGNVGLIRPLLNTVLSGFGVLLRNLYGVVAQTARLDRHMNYKTLAPFLSIWRVPAEYVNYSMYVVNRMVESMAITADRLIGDKHLVKMLRQNREITSKCILSLLDYMEECRLDHEEMLKVGLIFKTPIFQSLRYDLTEVAIALGKNWSSTTGSRPDYLARISMLKNRLGPTVGKALGGSWMIEKADNTANSYARWKADSYCDWIARKVLKAIRQRGEHGDPIDVPLTAEEILGRRADARNLVFARDIFGAQFDQLVNQYAERLRQARMNGENMEDVEFIDHSDPAYKDVIIRIASKINRPSAYNRPLWFQTSDFAAVTGMLFGYPIWNQQNWSHEMSTGTEEARNKFELFWKKLGNSAASFTFLILATVIMGALTKPELDWLIWFFYGERRQVPNFSDIKDFNTGMKIVATTSTSFLPVVYAAAATIITGLGTSKVNSGIGINIFGVGVVNDAINVLRETIQTRDPMWAMYNFIRKYVPNPKAIFNRMDFSSGTVAYRNATRSIRVIAILNDMKKQEFTGGVPQYTPASPMIRRLINSLCRPDGIDWAGVEKERQALIQYRLSLGDLKPEQTVDKSIMSRTPLNSVFGRILSEDELVQIKSSLSTFDNMLINAVEERFEQYSRRYVPDHKLPASITTPGGQSTGKSKAKKQGVSAFPSGRRGF